MAKSLVEQLLVRSGSGVGLETSAVLVSVPWAESDSSPRSSTSWLSEGPGVADLNGILKELAGNGGGRGSLLHNGQVG